MNWEAIKKKIIMKVLLNICFGGFSFSGQFESHLLSLGIDIKNDENIGDPRDYQPIVEAAIQFGLDKASGAYSALAVEEIPDGVNYSIDEYDGMEHIDSMWICVSAEDLKKGLNDDVMSMVLKGCDIKLK